MTNRRAEALVKMCELMVKVNGRPMTYEELDAQRMLTKERGKWKEVDDTIR